MKLLLVSVLCLMIVNANAELFKWKDADGNTIFSDQPPPDQKNCELEVEKQSLPKVNTLPALEINNGTRTSVPKNTGEDRVVYKNLAIISPVNDSEVRENSGKVTISVRVEPDNFAERGHQLVIYMDGIEVSKGNSTAIMLDNVDRGTHEIKASIINHSGFVIKETRNTTFTLHRYHT